MQGSTSRRQMVFAGLIGGLIGAFVFASWGLPPAAPALSQQSVPAANSTGPQTEPAAANARPDLRMAREALWAQQKAEAENYPGVAITPGDANAAPMAQLGPLPHTFHDMLVEHQHAELENYPGR